MSEALTGATGLAPAAPPIDPGLYHFDDDGSGKPFFQSVLSDVSAKPAQGRQSGSDNGVQPPPDLPSSGGHDGGAAGATQTVVHQGACAVVGAVLGGVGGGFIGAVGEGLAGAGAGTLIEPGGDTIMGAGAGVIDGVKNGAFFGSATGAALGAHLCGGDTPPPPLHVMESRSDPGLTQATGPIGSVPTGARSTTSAGASPKDKAGVDSENQVADKTAAAGYPTVQNPTEGPNSSLTPERMIAEGLNPRAKPDLLLSDRVFDTYTPQVDNTVSLRRGIAQKVEDGQTHRVIVDVRGTTQTQSSLRAAIRQQPVPGLKKVITLTKKSLGQPFRP